MEKIRPWYRFFVEKPEVKRELENILKHDLFKMLAAAIVFGFSLAATLAPADASVLKYGFVSPAALLLGVFCYVDCLILLHRAPREGRK